MKEKIKDPFDILGLSAQATETEIKKAYRRLSFQLHPDRNKSPAANEQMSRLNAAYAQALVEVRERGSFDGAYQMLKLILDCHGSVLTAKLKALELIKKGGDFNRIYSIASYRAPLFHLACLMGRFELAEILVLGHADLNLKDNRGKTGWDVLFQDRGLGGAKSVLDDTLETVLKIHTPNAVDHNSGQSLFMKLIENGWQRMAEKYLASGKVHVSYRNPLTDKSALELALEKGWIGMVFQLFEKGAFLKEGNDTLKNMDFLLNFLMKRPYLSKGEEQAVGYLIDKKIGLMQKDSVGRLPLENAERYGKKVFYQQIKQKMSLQNYKEQTVCAFQGKMPYDLNAQVNPDNLYISVCAKER